MNTFRTSPQQAVERIRRIAISTKGPRAKMRDAKSVLYELLEETGYADTVMQYRVLEQMSEAERVA